MADISDVKKTFQIHTNVGPTTCPDCGQNIDVAGSKVDGAINHVLAHGYRLLYLGGEWADDSQGKSVTHTTAILGK